MELRTTKKTDLKIISTWFDSELEAKSWGGPRIRFPITFEQLIADIDWEKAESYSLIEHEELIGFAQIFQKFGYSHLGRVAISPIKRGQKLGSRLVELLIEKTKSANRDYSLFVYEDNLAAIQIYQKLGFQFHEYPEGLIEKAGSLFMVKGFNPAVS